MKTTILAALLISSTLLSACASVPMASPEKDQQAKTFATSQDQANIYIYRNENLGAAVHLDLLLDSRPVGQTAAKTYMLISVPPGKHTIISKGETDDEFTFDTAKGKNYFIWQEVKMGLFMARSLLHLVDETTGKTGVGECKLIDSNSQK